MFLKDLPTDEVKLAVAELFLRHLWYYMNKLGEYRGLRLYVVIDEAHRLAYEGSPVAFMLREGRKFGVGVILSSQQPDDFESKNLVFQNTASKIVFCCPADRHASTMARQFVGTSPETLKKEIQRLKQFTAFVNFHGREEVLKVRIRPYYERVG